MTSYTKNLALAMMDDFNPTPEEAASMNLNDSEEEVEVAEKCLQGSRPW